MRKLSVFYEHILQACEQSGKTIPEVLAFCREQGISAVEMNYSLFASEREVIAPMLSDAGLVISCMHETFDFSHDTDLGRAQQMLDTAASQQVVEVMAVRRHRRQLRRRQKQAQLNQVKPEKAAEQLFMDRMTIQVSIRRWMSMARSMF